MCLFSTTTTATTTTTTCCCFALAGCLPCSLPYRMDLFLFDLLTYCTMDLWANNHVASALVTFTLSYIITVVRNEWGETNLAKKTLVDGRFLI